MIITSKTVLVTGATGYTGRRLLARIVHERRWSEVRLLLRPTSSLEGIPRSAVSFHEGDLSGNRDRLRSAFCGVDTVLHLAHIRYAEPVCAAVDRKAIQHIVLISSLRACSCVPSASTDEVREGERIALASGLPTTVLRPSMIYGPGDDRNISRLVVQLQRRRLIPMIGTECLHQPVLVDDVVEAILACAGKTQTIGRRYAIAGAEALSTRKLVTAVGEVVGVRPVGIPLPGGLVASALLLLQKIGLRLPITADQVRRLQEDKQYSNEPASADFGYQPCSFAEGIQRAYGSSR
ncbi:MAG: NAD-dependent epimerase/dehydratase family protein [Candidatus Latescibacterota bacterium]|nr:NAD-dependent epimerase/dehydratase family protein [Candidatus Latescibacterota bacterium]